MPGGFENHQVQNCMKPALILERVALFESYLSSEESCLKYVCRLPLCQCPPIMWWITHAHTHVRAHAQIMGANGGNWQFDKDKVRADLPTGAQVNRNI